MTFARFSAFAVAIACAGCTIKTRKDYDIEAMSQTPQQLCVQAFGPAGQTAAAAAQARIAAARIDCTPFAALISAASQADAARRAEALRMIQLGQQIATPPPPPPAPTQTRCYSRTINGQTYTTCQ